MWSRAGIIAAMIFALKFNGTFDLTAIGTLALAVATFVSLLLARRSLKQTRAEIDISRKAVEQAHRPVLVPVADYRRLPVVGRDDVAAFPFVPEAGVLVVPVENIGSGPALSVRATIRLQDVDDEATTTRPRQQAGRAAGVAVQRMVPLAIHVGRVAEVPGFLLTLTYEDVARKLCTTAARFIPTEMRYDNPTIVSGSDHEGRANDAHPPDQPDQPALHAPAMFMPVVSEEHALRLRTVAAELRRGNEQGWKPQYKDGNDKDPILQRTFRAHFRDVAERVDRAYEAYDAAEHANMAFGRLLREETLEPVFPAEEGWNLEELDVSLRNLRSEVSRGELLSRVSDGGLVLFGGLLFVPRTVWEPCPDGLASAELAREKLDEWVKGVASSSEMATARETKAAVEPTRADAREALEPLAHAEIRKARECEVCFPRQ
jgi:hypothetical protein